MGKLSSILLGTVSGAALALFLTSDKGKQVCSQAQDFLILIPSLIIDIFSVRGLRQRINTKQGRFLL